MIRRTPLALALIATTLGCPSDPEPTNPATLWLGLDGRETEVKLIDYEPPPF